MKITFVVVMAMLVAYAAASSHSEAPNTVRQPPSDNTDFYAFRSYETGRENFVVFIMNVLPLQAPFGGPNYFSLSDSAFYEIYIDKDGDANEDLTFQFYYGATLGGNMINTTVDIDPNDCNNPTVPGFKVQNGGIELPIGTNMVPIALKFVGPVFPGDNSNLNWHESYFINTITGLRNSSNIVGLTHDNGQSTFTKPFDYAGQKSFPDYVGYVNQYLYNLDDIAACGTGNGSGGKVFVGQRRESFSVNLGRVFDLINLVPVPGFNISTVDDPANNVISTRSITSFVLEVPIACLTNVGNGVIGSWSGIRRLIHTSGGGHSAGKQVSRLGQPLVNELVIGLFEKGDFNEALPNSDIQFLKFVQTPTIPEIVNILFLSAVNSLTGLNLATLAPTTPRNDLITVFLKGVPGLNQQATITPSEMLRLNTSTPAAACPQQSRFGVIGSDSAGFPNGRRPGDDVVDIILRVAMGRLCNSAVPDFACNATVGGVDFLDGAPIGCADFPSSFPWLNTPLPGAVSAGGGGSHASPRQKSFLAQILEIL